MSAAGLVSVLAALTSEPDALWWRMMTTDHETRAVAAGIEWRIAGEWAPLRLWSRVPETKHTPMHTITPAEAVEVLATRDLWPWPVGDDASPRWWCHAECTEHEPMVGLYDCGGCGGSGYVDGHTADPPTLAALVAVASLGVDTLRAAEGLALQLVGRSPRVVFRAVSRETLRAWTEERVYRDGDASLAYVAAHEALGAPSTSPLHYGHGETWPESFPWLGLSGGHVARRHWSMVRDLGLLGAMLVDLDGDRVTLAVEAI